MYFSFFPVMLFLSRLVYLESWHYDVPDLFWNSLKSSAVLLILFTLFTYIHMFLFCLDISLCMFTRYKRPSKVRVLARATLAEVGCYTQFCTTDWYQSKAICFKLCINYFYKGGRFGCDYAITILEKRRLWWRRLCWEWRTFQSGNIDMIWSYCVEGIIGFGKFWSCFWQGSSCWWCSRDPRWSGKELRSSDRRVSRQRSLWFRQRSSRWWCSRDPGWSRKELRSSVRRASMCITTLLDR